MQKKNILISDASLRDGSHAVNHQLSKEQIAHYCKMADAAKIPVIEVGHGNGLGASSMQVGESKTTDEVILMTARENLKFSKLGIHIIPGFATINKDVKHAITLGVDVFRVASHCSEADITQKHIEYIKNAGKEAYGVLMMSHMVDKHELLTQAKKMASYGAEAFVFMDSSGHFLPDDVRERVSILVEGLDIPVGFHAHNNLGMGIANSVAAIEAGATITDASIKGFGAGAGNAQLEVLVAVLEKMGFNTGIDLYKILDAADWSEENLMEEIPVISSISIVSGLSGVFSGFLKPVIRIAAQYNLDPRDLFFELGKRTIIAGQEDLIISIASELSAHSKNFSLKGS